MGAARRDSDALTPMMAQYRRLRSELPPNTFLFFRLGDFYELFFEDAIEASKILEITLTRRQGVPMCGVPYHSAASYVARLTQRGHKVAICEQTEDPAQAKGLVRREITRIVTPGALPEELAQEGAQTTYIAALHRLGSAYGLAVLEHTTGQFWVEEFQRPDEVENALAKYAPAECIVPEGQRDEPALLRAIEAGRSLCTGVDDWIFLPEAALDRLTRHFGVLTLDGFGCADRPAAYGAAGALLDYLGRQLRRDLKHIRSLSFRRPDDFLWMDAATMAHLDLFPSAGSPRSIETTLVGVLGVTCTPMGGRLLREWLRQPLARVEPIRRRHEAVEALARDRIRLRELREALKRVRDIERLLMRLSANAGNARDLLALAESLEQLPAVRSALENTAAPLLQELSAEVISCPELSQKIRAWIVDDPPVSIREGGLIRSGCHPELDELREAAREAHRWLAEFQAAEQERTGIRNLKVRYNQVFGYYIEVSKSQLKSVPPNYIRKQTLVNAERFVTPELKEYERRVLGAQERAMQLEFELFQQLREEVLAQTDTLQRTAAAVAAVDVLAAFADRALALRYVRPVMTEGDTIRIRAGRHPIIEHLPSGEHFVPNDVHVDRGENQILLITGPNMAGKSTYIRQVALIVVMAQAGSFVPATEAEIGLVDRLFTRIGASDELARGRSTFMVEMQETANILNNLTDRSLIVLDEIGRGTSTFDGISIAWAVAEYLHQHPAHPRTLFATHYHELTDLALTLPGVKNYNVAVQESGGRIVFLHRIVPGAADQSYGIHVAQLAGLPLPVIERAREILANLEESELEGGQPKIARSRGRRSRSEDDRQLKLF